METPLKILLFTIGFCFFYTIGFSQMENDSVHYSKVDSVVREIVNYNDFPGDVVAASLLHYKDSTRLIDYRIPLIKRVYYPAFDITFEYRQDENDHIPYDIIVCYNQKGYIAIPFYWSVDFSDNWTFTDKFQEKLNEAIQLFLGEAPYNDKTYSYFFTDYLLDNLTSHTIYPLSLCGSYQSKYKGNRIGLTRKEGKRIIKNIEELEPLNDQFNLLYDTHYNCQIIIDFTEHGIIVRTINDEYFFRLIF